MHLHRGQRLRDQLHAGHCCFEAWLASAILVPRDKELMRPMTEWADLLRSSVVVESHCIRALSKERSQMELENKLGY
jgi:hypothetical protein